MGLAKTENDSNGNSFEEALDHTGFGKYNVGMLITCSLLIQAMYLDIFGFSVALPALACDMSLSATQQGLLSAVPLIGVILSSYPWGLCADTRGRRKTLLIAMPISLILSLASTMAPNFLSLAILKFLSVSFSTSANAAGFVLLAESVPSRHRSRHKFLMASATMFTQFTISSSALPIFSLSLGYEIPWLGVVYRPWRLLLQVICLPSAFGILYNIMFLKESPKYLLSRNRHEEALEVFKSIYKSNTGFKKESYTVRHVYLDEPPVDSSESSTLKKMWNQTAPLFKPPLLKNSAILYYLLLTAYMPSTGYTMWVPTIANAYFSGGEDHHGRTFCEVASQSIKTHSNSTESAECTGIIDPKALYATMVYSAAAASLLVLLSFLVGLGKKTLTLIVFTISSICGGMLLFIRVPMLSMALFFLFLYVTLILGNVNTYLVELNPTHLRGMTTCLSVVVARGSGFFSVQIIASLQEDYCTPMLSAYVALVITGLLVAFLLPSDPKSKADKKEIDVIDP